MKQFNFHEAKSVKEAVKAATKKSAFLSGGQTLIPSLKMRLSSFDDIINVKNLTLIHLLHRMIIKKVDKNK